MARPPPRAEVWTKVSGPDPLESDELIAPRSAPPSWRLRPALVEADGPGVLSSLRDQLLEVAVRHCFVVGVTGEYSVLEAKSAVAARLSAMLSEGGRVRVLLLEANFDFPAVHRLLAIEMPPAAGFSQQLRSRVRGGPRKPWSVIRCTDTLHVLAEGVVRSPGILLSQEFADAVDELRRCYDIIVIDCPVAGLGLDTKPIDAVSDGIAVVAPPGVLLSDALERAAKWFARKELMAAVPADGVPR